MKKGEPKKEGTNSAAENWLRSIDCRVSGARLCHEILFGMSRRKRSKNGPCKSGSAHMIGTISIFLYRSIIKVGIPSSAFSNDIYSHVDEYSTKPLPTWFCFRLPYVCRFLFTCWAAQRNLYASGLTSTRVSYPRIHVSQVDIIILNMYICYMLNYNDMYVYRTLLPYHQSHQ